MKKTVAALAVLAMAIGNASACTFSWHHYGDDTTKVLISQEIGSHITDEYCAKFNKKNEIFMQSTTYLLSNLAAGHAIVGIRPRGSKVHPLETHTMLSTDTNGRTSGDAQKLAVRATLKAIDNLMSELNTYEVTQ